MSRVPCISMLLDEFALITAKCCQQAASLLAILLEDDKFNIAMSLSFH